MTSTVNLEADHWSQFKAFLNAASEWRWWVQERVTRGETLHPREQVLYEATATLQHLAPDLADQPTLIEAP